MNTHTHTHTHLCRRRSQLRLALRPGCAAACLGCLSEQRDTRCAQTPARRGSVLQQLGWRSSGTPLGRRGRSP